MSGLSLLLRNCLRVEGFLRDTRSHHDSVTSLTLPFALMRTACNVVSLQSNSGIKSIWSLTAAPSSPFHPRRAPLTATNDHSPSTCQSSASDRTANPEYIKEYDQLKSLLINNTRRSGGAIAAYMLVVVDGEASLCALLGMVFSNLYLFWLYRDVDSVTGNDFVPMAEAKKIEAPVARILAVWAASYYHALRPRLLLPISLAAIMAYYNSTAESPLSGMEETALLLGFLSHKVALLLKVIEEVSPKGFATEATRPRIDNLDEEEALQLDKWGRPRKPQIRMPTEAMPEDFDPNNPGLLPSLLVKAAENVDDDDGNR